ncbi:MAG: HD domain-containing protein [Firmicutes bacterium]|nr:HD domain-containing protein [Bacillota bacterium]
MRTARDILSPEGILLLPRGFELKQWIAHHLLARGITELSIQLDYKPIEHRETISPVKLAERHFFKEYDRALDVIESTLYRLSQKQSFEIEEVEHAVSDLMPVVLSCPRIMHFLAKARQAGESLYTHLLNVGIITMLLGEWAKLTDEEIINWGVAGVMHDIGKSQVAPDLLDKPGVLEPEEWDTMKAHTVFGYMMAMRSGIQDSGVLATILQHHEREDGSGYPNGLVGSQIHPTAKAVTVADVFEAITAERPYRGRFTIYHAADALQGMLYGKVCPEMCTTFLEGIASFYVGNRVRLNNGQVGEVIWVNKYLPTRPTVRVGESYVDLMRQRDLSIEEEVFDF